MTEERARLIINKYSGKITCIEDANMLIEAIDAILIKYGYEKETNQNEEQDDNN